MTDARESTASPRRISVSIKLGGVFLLLGIIAGGNLYLSNTLHDTTLDTAGIINQSGRLRYLSQEVVLHSAGLMADGEGVRQRVRDTEKKFEENHAALTRKVGQLHPLMRSAGDNLEGRLEQIRKIWQLQHAALQRVMTEPAPAARQAAQREVEAGAAAVLDEAVKVISGSFSFRGKSRECMCMSAIPMVKPSSGCRRNWRWLQAPGFRPSKSRKLNVLSLFTWRR